MFSHEPRCIYRNNPLGEVICQLRFPDILTISANPPADFQEAIRGEFPVYAKRLDTSAPKVSGTPGQYTLENPSATVNHQFSSLDGVWRVNLTSNFISLTCTRYSRWEDFASRLDKPLAAFIRIYKPACFQRIGLRYLNFISRNALGLEDAAFSQLIEPYYLGPLADPEVAANAPSRCTVDTELAIRGGCRAKIHAGPGMIKRSGKEDKEAKFIFDQDLYMTGQLPVNLSAGVLQTLHTQAFAIFRGAITDMLHQAMEPEYH